MSQQKADPCFTNTQQMKPHSLEADAENFMIRGGSKSEIPIHDQTTKLMQNIKVNQADNQLILAETPSESSIWNLSMVGKILSPKVIPFKVLQQVLNAAWKTHKEVSFRALGENSFICSFGHEFDKRKVKARGSWSVKGSLVILKDCQSDLAIQELDFSETSFWIRIVGLPLGLFNKENAWAIAGRIGKTLEIDFADKEGCWTDYIKVKVLLNILHPLPPGFFLAKQNNNQHWVQFKYEFLPDFCYNCGLVDHEKTDCLQEIPSVIQSPMGYWLKAYGPWLRIDPGNAPADPWSEGHLLKQTTPLDPQSTPTGVKLIRVPFATIQGLLICAEEEGSASNSVTSFNEEVQKKLLQEAANEPLT